MRRRYHDKLIKIFLAEENMNINQEKEFNYFRELSSVRSHARNLEVT